MVKAWTPIPMDRDHWQSMLSEQEIPRGYSDGFKLLFCPWSVIDTADNLFLSLNPGNDPSGEFMRVASDERGNSYLVKREARHSPIALQYEKLCELIGEDPEEVLAGALMPYRTPKWKRRRDAPNIEIAAEFWRAVILGGRIKHVFCMGRDVEEAVASLTGATFETEIPANWSDYRIRWHVTPDGVKVFGLLHFSTFKMLSRPACVEQLTKLFELDHL